MRIAIIMLIHKYSQQQAKLIRHLAKDFDVFIHIDKRTKFLTTEISDARVFAYKKYRVYWGNFNQIRATLLLFEEANRKRYDRYIFISGEDIPIKTNAEIYAYFFENHKEYFEFSKLPRSVWGDNGGFDRIDFFWLNSLSRGKTNRVKRMVYILLEKINTKYVIPLMKKKGMHRRLEIPYYGGTNWMDLTYKCVFQLLAFVKDNKKYLNSFKHTRCADEIFFQTIICNYVEGVELQNKSLRYVDWVTGPETPRVLRMEDYEKLKATDCLFARKVNYEIDANIIDKIYNDLDFA